MSFINISNKPKKPILKAETDLTPQEVVSINELVADRQGNNPFFKAVIPEYLYKPPFGFPRNINVPFLRNLAKNPYINSIIKTLQDEVTSTAWDILIKEDIELTRELEFSRRAIKEFINNPNDDDESFAQILRKSINDFVVLDSPCWVKVYNPLQELIQFRYVDGGTIVKNPDIFGRIGGREDIIMDSPNIVFSNNEASNVDLDKADFGARAFDSAVTQFRSQYAERAAYFQFSNTLMTSLPIPFGKKEIIFMMSNPSPETVYSFVSPLMASVDITLSLLFGSKYNLDFYMNGNTPEGIIQMSGAKPEQIDALKERLNASMYTGERDLQLTRRIGYRMPVTNSEDTKFIPLNFSSREMEIIAQQEWFTKVLWANMGVTPAEMGFGQHSNKATDQNQSAVNARKGIKPLLSIIEYYINTQLINELPNGKMFEFKFDNFDVDDEIKRRTLQEQEIRMGIKTWQMIAAEEGLDLEKLKADKEENMPEVNDLGAINSNTDEDGNKEGEVKSVHINTPQTLKSTSKSAQDSSNTDENDENTANSDDDEEMKGCGTNKKTKKKMKNEKQGYKKKMPENKSAIDLDMVMNQIVAEIEETGEDLVDQAMKK